MKYIKTAGITFIYTCIFFILVSNDFYGDKSIIPMSIFYYPLGFIFILIIIFILKKVEKIKGIKIVLHLILSLGIFISITQGTRWAADDILKQYYNHYFYETLLNFPEYVQDRGNLFSVKVALFKEGIFVRKLYEGRSDIEDTIISYIGKGQKIKEKIYIDYESGYYFIYNWDERRIISKLSKEELIDQAVDNLQVSKEQVDALGDSWVKIIVGNNSQHYYFIPREGKVVFISEDTYE